MERFAHQDAVKALLDHLDIRKAHFAARLDTDWRDLVSTLTLVCTGLDPSIPASHLAPLPGCPP